MRSPFSPVRLFTFILLLIGLLILLQFGLVTLAFEKLDLTPSKGLLLVFASVLGSTLNMPLWRIRAEPPSESGPQNPHPQSLLRLPVVPFTGHTLIAINVGGCMIPLVLSVSLMHRFALPMPQVLIAIGLVSVACYAMSRPVPGLGIGMPPLIAPFAAAIVAVTVNNELAAPLAYICGTLGVLIGADLMRLKDVARLGTPIASIGGAGTFDGIFLTGIVAVLLT